MNTMMIPLLLLTLGNPALAEDSPFVLIDTTLPASPKTTPTPVVDRSDAPPAVPLAEQMLSAWHPQDLPSADEWAQVTDAVPALLWLAGHAVLNRDRQRALSALRHFDHPDAKHTLFAKALDSALPELIRLGALDGLRGQHLTPPMCAQLATALQDQSALITKAVHRVTTGQACSK